MGLDLKMLPNISLQKIIFFTLQSLSKLYNSFWNNFSGDKHSDRVSVQRIIMRHRDRYFDISNSKQFASLHESFENLNSIFEPNMIVKIRTFNQIEVNLDWDVNEVGGPKSTFLFSLFE